MAGVTSGRSSARAIHKPRVGLCSPRSKMQSSVRASAQGYAHAVHLDLPTGAVPSDDYFDLLPGTGREIQVVSSEPLDTETIGVTCVNAR